MFGNLDSKLAMSVILGYAFTWDQIEGVMKCLSKKGKQYYEKNHE